MFFRRARVKEMTLEDRLEQLRRSGFKVEKLPGTALVRISRDDCAVALELTDGMPRMSEPPGILVDGEIAALVDGGYQKFFLTPSGKRKPALATDLRRLHDFQEDLRAALGQISLYNEALGTVSTFYLYDRVKDRDKGVGKREWE